MFTDRTRIAGPEALLDALGADIDAYLAPLTTLLKDTTGNRAAIIAGLDGFLDGAVGLLERASRFAIPQSGWGFAYAWRRSALGDLLAQVRDLVTRWTQKQADFDAKIAAYDALPAGTSDDDRFRALRAAEAEINTQIEPLPPSPATLRTQLDTKRAAFVARRDQFAAVLTRNDATFTPFLAAVTALLPIAQWDAQPFDLTPFGDRAVVLAGDLAGVLAGHRATITARSSAVMAQLAAYDAAADQAVQAAALQSAAKALFGDDFLLIPEFGPSPAQGDDWANAVAASTGGALLDWLKTTAKIDFPVDEWLHGVARVRPQLRAWETILLFANALGHAEPSLLPVQFPPEATAPWVAMQFPSTYTLASDRLLYTAHYSVPFDKTAHQCGLLLDEWTEALPATDRYTGIAFNFRRPDNEPPQTILLVTPASASGTWQWDDLTGALNETLDLAKKRAVEPTQLDGTAYAPLLPATTMAVTLDDFAPLRAIEPYA